jgi:methyltransferase family protein
MSFIKRALDRALFSQRAFEFFQRFGIHVLQQDFSSPIPDTRLLEASSDLWETESELPGVELSIARELDLLENVFSRYRKECDFPLNPTSTPHDYYIGNGAFGFISAAVLHCMIRHFAPKTMIEVGSGNSTYVSARACRMNAEQGQSTRLISVEPYPNQVLKAGFAGLSELVPEQVESLDPGFFSQLEDRDILFIDSSHVVRTGGDVNFLYLEVLPRLKPGVLVHIHDIFFPKQYPKEWVTRNRTFWTEQYLLQAFLTYNSKFEVLWCGSYIYAKYAERLSSVFPPPAGLGFRENYFSSSFWMRRTFQ